MQKQKTKKSGNYAIYIDNNTVDGIEKVTTQLKRIIDTDPAVADSAVKVAALSCIKARLDQPTAVRVENCDFQVK